MSTKSQSLRIIMQYTFGLGRNNFSFNPFRYQAAIATIRKLKPEFQESLGCQLLLTGNLP